MNKFLGKLPESSKTPVVAITSALLAMLATAGVHNYAFEGFQEKAFKDLGGALWLNSKPEVLRDIGDTVDKRVNELFSEKNLVDIETILPLYVMTESDLKKAATKLTKHPNDVKKEDTYKWDRACKGYFGQVYLKKWSRSRADSEYYCEIMIEHRKTLTSMSFAHANLLALLQLDENQLVHEKSKK